MVVALLCYLLQTKLFCVICLDVPKRVLTLCLFSHGNMHGVASALSSGQLKLRSHACSCATVQLFGLVIVYTVCNSCHLVSPMMFSGTGKCIPGFVGFAAATGHEARAVQGDSPLHLTILHPICLNTTSAHLQPASETQLQWHLSRSWIPNYTIVGAVHGSWYDGVLQQMRSVYYSLLQSHCVLWV